MDVAFLVGTGHSGEDVLQKAPWAHAARRLRVHVASRIDPERHLAPGVPVPVRGLTPERLRGELERLRASAASFHVVYGADADAPGDVAAGAGTDGTGRQGARALREAVAEEEARLGVSLRMMASMDRRFFDRPRGEDRRDADALRRAFLLYARFFRRFYAETGAKALVTTQEDDLFSLTALFVARSVGVRVVGQMVGRLPGRGLMFCEDFTHLLEWAPAGGAGGADSAADAAHDEAGLAALYTEATVVGDALRRTRGYWDLASLPKRLRDASFVAAWEGFRRNAARVDPAEDLIIPSVRLLREAARHATRVLRRYRAARLGTRQAPPAPYVLFPLHFMDDAQMTFREPFLDQEHLVRALARALPEGHRLVVKPHPHWGGTDLSAATLRRIAALPGVVLVDPAVPAGPLLRGAACVATVNSTVGFEALVHGVPVLTIGHDFYCHDPPCVVARDLSLLPQALMEAVAARPERRAAGLAFAARTRANTVAVQGEDVGPGHYAFTAGDGAAVAAALERALGAARTPPRTAARRAQAPQAARRTRSSRTPRGGP